MSTSTNIFCIVNFPRVANVTNILRVICNPIQIKIRKIHFKNIQIVDQILLLVKINNEINQAQRTQR